MRKFKKIYKKLIKKEDVQSKDFNEISYSETVHNLCMFYKKINMISWCVILFGLVEPRILIPAFVISVLIFYNKKVRLSWRVSDFIEKLKIKQFDKAKDHLNKIELLDNEKVYTELKILYDKKVAA